MEAKSMRILALIAALALIPTASAFFGPYWTGPGSVDVFVAGSPVCTSTGPVTLGALPSSIEPSEFLLVIEADCPPQALKLRGELTGDGYRFDDHVDGALVRGTLRYAPDAHDQWRLEVDVSTCGILACAMPQGARIEAWLNAAIFV